MSIKIFRNFLYLALSLSIFLIPALIPTSSVHAAYCYFTVEVDAYHIYPAPDTYDPLTICRMGIFDPDYRTSPNVNCVSASDCEWLRRSYEEQIGICDAWATGTYVGKITSVGELYDTSCIPAPLTPTLSFSGSPTNVSWWTGGTITLSWTAQNADSCTASGDWSGSKPTSGSDSPYIWPFSGPKTYNLSCTGPGGTVSDSVTINVGNADVCPNIDGEQTGVPSGMVKDGSGNCVTLPPPAPVSLSFSGSPTNVSWWTGGAVDLTWSASNAYSCTASGDWSGSKATTGNDSIYIWPFASTKTYTLNCFGSGGSDEKSVTVTIGNADVCPNINGEQTGVPEGMIKDGSGNCVTPPPPTDVCPNIAGNQDTVPSDMTVNGGGNCVAIETLCDDGSNPPCDDVPPGGGGDGTGGGGDGGGNGTGGGGNGGGGSGGGPGGDGSAGGGNSSTPDFTISGSSSVLIQILSSVGGTAMPASMNVNPVNGFSSPVVLSIESIKTASGVNLSEAEATFVWGDDKRPSETLSYNSALDNYVGLTGLIGTKLYINIKGDLTEPYFITVLGTSGSDQATHVIKLEPISLTPAFKEI